MKYFFSILFFISLVGNAKTIHINNSSGFYTMSATLQADSALSGAVSAKDSVILSGTMDGGWIKNLRGHIVIDMRLVILGLNNGFYLDSLNGLGMWGKLIICGYHPIHGPNDYVFRIDYRCNYLTIDGEDWYCKGFTGFIVNLDNNDTHTYPNYYRSGIEIMRLNYDSLSGGFIYGGGDSSDGGKDVIRGIYIHNNKINNCRGGGEAIRLINAHPAYIYDNTFTNTDSCLCNHSSTVYVLGILWAWNNYFFNNAGDHFRNGNVHINDPAHGWVEDSTSYFWNNVGVSSRRYPFIECNFQVNDTGGVWQGGDHSYYVVQYNSWANSFQHPEIGLGSSALVAAFAKNIQEHNNTASNISRDVAPSTPTSNYLYQDGAGYYSAGGTDTTGNYYEGSATGTTFKYVDTFRLRLQSNSPLIGLGTPFTKRTSDIQGIRTPWGSASEPGANEYYVPTTIKRRFKKF